MLRGKRSFVFFQRLKAALTQQHPQVTNGDTAKGHPSGLVKTQSEEPRPQSLQQPATSTTETPVGQPSGNLFLAPFLVT